MSPSAGPGPLLVELITTDGVFELDGGRWDVTNNVWILGDDRSVTVIDAPHDHRPIVEALGGRRLHAIVLSHGHNDHLNAAVALRDATDAPVYLHPADRMLWDAVYPDEIPDRELSDGLDLVLSDAAGSGGTALRALRVLHTPGHSPGSCCFALEGDVDPETGQPVVFSGDTLFCGGPGATGRSFSDEGLILRSIQERLLTLPDSTIVHTGHGESTTVGAERSGIEELVRSRDKS